MLLVDGNNVMGARPDGWWRDRPAAMQRLVDALDEHAAATGEQIAVVFDGRELDLRAARVEVGFAPVADDALAARAAPGVTLATSDRELVARARAAGAETVGAGTLLDLLA